MRLPEILIWWRYQKQGVYFKASDLTITADVISVKRKLLELIIDHFGRSSSTMSVENYHKPWHLTPASSEWSLLQLTEGLREQSMSLLSLPLQSTPSRWIGPVPAPKWASLKGSGSVIYKVYLWYKNYHPSLQYHRWWSSVSWRMQFTVSTWYPTMSSFHSK